jgi:hypothetical protein
MAFNDEVQKMILPSAQNYIALTEARFKEPLSRALNIRKAINTLRNPANVATARRKSGGAYTQLLRFYEEQQSESRERNAEMFTKIDEALNEREQGRQDSMGSYATSPEFKRDIQNLIKDVNSEGAEDNVIERIEAKLKEYGAIDKKGNPQYAAVYAMIDLKNGINPQNKESIKVIDKKLREYLVSADDMLSSANKIGDVERYVKLLRFPSFASDTEVGRRNRERASTKNYLMSKNPITQRPYYLDFELDSKDINQYENFDVIVNRLRNIVFGQSDFSSVPTVDASEQEKSEYIEQIPGLKLENNRVIVDPESDGGTKKAATKFIKAFGSKNPTYDQFVKSPTIAGAYAGFEDGTKLAERMEARADELEKLEDQYIEAAADEGRLTVAEQSVLTNPFFARRGYRRTPRYGLLKRRAEARKTLAEIEADEAAEVEEAPAEVEEVSAEVEAKVGSSGVPIIPAVINRFKKAYDRATTADDSEKDATHRELMDVVAGFKRLPEDIQSQFPRNFVRAVYELGTQQKQGKDDTPEQQQMDFASAIKSLDDAAITTKTIGEYVADVGSDPNATALESTADMVEFLNHPDSVGEGSSVVGRNLPVGSVAFGFLDTMNQIADGSASRSDLMNVFAEAQELSQQDRPDFFDTDKYGRYESVDNFVAAMDRQRGGIARKRTRRRTEQDRPSSPSPETPRTPESYASPAMQEMIAEFAAGPEDEAPEVEIPELKDDPRAFAQRQAQRAAELQAIDEDRRRRSERPAITGTDDTIADRVLRDATRTSAPRRTMDPEPPADPGREQAIADFNARPGQAPHGSVFPVVSPGSQETDDDSGREQAIADFNARPGQAPHGSVFPVVSPGSQETDDDQSLTEADEAAIARADKKFAEKYGPGDPPVLVDGKFTEADSSKPGPGKTGAFGNDVPTALDPTPEQQLAQTQASLPGGGGPRVGDRDEDVDREREANQKDSERRSRQAMLSSIRDLRGSIIRGELQYKDAIDAADSISSTFGRFADSRNFDINLRNMANELYGKPMEQERPEDPATMKPRDVAKIIRDEFARDGFSQNQITALMATAIQESSLNPLASNLENESSHGIFQFNQDRGEGKGVATATLQDPYFQIAKTKDAIASRPELSFFREYPNAPPETLIRELTYNFIRPKDYDTEEVQKIYRGRIPEAAKILSTIDESSTKVAGP